MKKRRKKKSKLNLGAVVKAATVLVYFSIENLCGAGLTHRGYSVMCSNYHIEKKSEPYQ